MDWTDLIHNYMALYDMWRLWIILDLWLVVERNPWQNIGMSQKFIQSIGEYVWISGMTKLC